MAVPEASRAADPNCAPPSRNCTSPVALPAPGGWAVTLAVRTTDCPACDGLIEDVSTTGDQVRRAAEALRADGVEILAIVLAIDRGGADHLRDAGYAVEAVATLRPKD